MEKGWVLTYSVNKLHLAQMAREMLSDHDIPSHIIDKRDSSYLFGEIELYVPQDNIVKAKQLIKEFES